MAYLTVPEYITRYGERETLLLTNDDSPMGETPTYDSAKVESMISDATEEVEGYIGRRYRIPLDNPPKIVKGWVASIARLKLAEGTSRVGDAIKEAADRSYKQLEQLVANPPKLDLPVPENTAPPTQVGGGSPRSSNDRPSTMFSSSVLDSFTAPFCGVDTAPRWTRGG